MFGITSRLTGVLSAAATSAILLAASTASAQQSTFVLFGDQSPDAPELRSPERYAHPITSPYFHEDSSVTTDLRLHFLYHDFPSAGVINGGSAKVAAAQVRVAITDRLQLVAYKDGYTDFDAGLTDESGWNDVAAGLKFAVINDWKSQFALAVGAGYEFPWGDDDVLHNSDELRLWVSANKGFGKLHFGGTFNYFFALGDDTDSPLSDSDYFSWHLHVDYWVCEWFSPVIEFNGYHLVDRNNEIVPFSGIDVTSLGGGGDVITYAVGAEVRPMDRLQIRGAVELPLTDDDDDLYGYRLTFSAIWSF